MWRMGRHKGGLKMYTFQDGAENQVKEAKRAKKEKKFASKRSKLSVFRGFMHDSGALKHFLSPAVRKPNPDWKGTPVIG
jgi:hypothetical protein